MSPCPHCGHDPAQLSLADYTGPKARNTDPSTSKLAALRNEPRRGTQRARILRAVINAGHHGATADELATWLALPYVSVSTRVSELVKGGWVAVDHERTRQTGAGGEANVVTPTTKAQDIPNPDLLAAVVSTSEYTGQVAA